MPIYKDPDDHLVVTFKYQAKKNIAKSMSEGREIFDDEEICVIMSPGMKDIKHFPANVFARWVDDPFTGEQKKQSYAERFSHQYRQFKAQATQTKSGTPLDIVPFLTEGKRAELRAQNVYTVEQLAAIEGAELKNLGPGGRDMKNQAEAYIEEGRAKAPNLMMAAELEALRARNAILEEDAKILAAKAAQKESEFENMSSEQLKEYITIHTGQAPIGNLARKSLIKMAADARPEKVA